MKDKPYHISANFLEAYEAFCRLKRDVNDKDAIDDLARLYGAERAIWLHESLTGKIKWDISPVLWQPGQALWVAMNIPEMEENITEEARRVGLTLFTGFRQAEIYYEQEWVDSILGNSVTVSKPKPVVNAAQMSIDDILAKYN